MSEQELTPATDTTETLTTQTPNSLLTATNPEGEPTNPEGEPTEQPRDSSEAPEAGDRLYANKYRSPEDLEKGYEQLLKKHREGNHVPEEYTLEPVFEQTGLQVSDDTQLGVLKEEMRDLNMNQEQAEWFFRKAAEYDAAIREQYAGADVKAELQSLQGEWGSKTQDRLSRVDEWARANVPPEVLLKPLHQTAAGIKFLESMMQKNRLPEQIESDRVGSSANSREEIDIQIAELMNQEGYWGSDAQGRALQSKVTALFERKNRLANK